jgi:hypothetical protein
MRSERAALFASILQGAQVMGLGKNQRPWAPAEDAARAKQPGRKFKHSALNKPIILDPLPLDERFHEEILEKERARVASEQLRKFDLLFDEYGISNEKESLDKFALLSFALARDFVKGFQVINKWRGRPKKLFANRDLLLVLVDYLKRQGRARTNRAAVGIIAEIEDPTLKSSRFKTRRKKRVRSLETLVSGANTSARRKRQHKIK